MFKIIAGNCTLCIEGDFQVEINGQQYNLSAGSVKAMLDEHMTPVGKERGDECGVNGCWGMLVFSDDGKLILCDECGRQA